jgi:putative selenate reductase molybdopterin-binding subunit
VVRSEIPHGRVVEIDTDRAEAMDGVLAVLTPWSDEVPDTRYTSAGQSYPEPSPWDMQILNEKVRYVGDPVVAVAAEDRETATAAAEAIDVDYEREDHVLDAEEAFDEDAPQLFDPSDVENKIVGHDYERNRMSHIGGTLGDVDAAYAREDVHVHESEWETIRQSHAQVELHTTLAYTDEDDRKVVITSTQVPNHTRRQLAPRRRWLRRQAGHGRRTDPDGADARHRSAGHLRGHARGGVPGDALAPPDDSACEECGHRGRFG